MTKLSPRDSARSCWLVSVVCPFTSQGNKAIHSFFDQQSLLLWRECWCVPSNPLIPLGASEPFSVTEPGVCVAHVGLLALKAVSITSHRELLSSSWGADRETFLYLWLSLCIFVPGPVLGTEKTGLNRVRCSLWRNLVEKYSGNADKS